MRTLLLMLGVACLLIGCGRKAAPVAEAPPKAEPRVRYDLPRQPPVKPLRPVDENEVANFNGPPKEQEVPELGVPEPRPAEPIRPAPKPPVEEEEELLPRKPAPAFDPQPLRPAEPVPAQVPGPGLQPGPAQQAGPGTRPPPLPPPPPLPGGIAPPQVPQQPGPLPAAPGPGPAATLPTRPAARKPVTEQDMKDIHVFVDTNSLAGGKMPPPALIFGALGAAGSPAAKLVASGDIVLTGARQRESCWAYQKGATTDGGWIVTNNGAEFVDAATAKKWVGGR